MRSISHLYFLGHCLQSCFVEGRVERIDSFLGLEKGDSAIARRVVLGGESRIRLSET